MYNFVTTTLINSNVYGPKKETLIETITKDGVTELQIKRIRSFFKGKLGEEVLSIYKAVGYDAKVASADIDLSKVFASTTVAEAEAGSYRLAIYIRLNGSENPYYANDFVFKGKPFYTEFTVKKGQTLDNVADTIKKNADKYIAMVYEDKLLDIETHTSDSTVTTGHVIINGTDEHQVFYSVAIEKFVNDGYRAFEGVFEAQAEVGQVFDIDPTTGALNSTARTNSEAAGGTDAIIVKAGIPGFGNYSHLMKDYRLPTAANTRWIKIQNDETPILGALYDQYTIKYCSDRGNMGTSVVGEPTKSVTEHVFWVKQGSDAQTALEAGLAALGWDKDATGTAAVAADTNKDGLQTTKEKITAKANA